MIPLYAIVFALPGLAVILLNHNHLRYSIHPASIAYYLFQTLVVIPAYTAATVAGLLHWLRPRRMFQRHQRRVLRTVLLAVIAGTATQAIRGIATARWGLDKRQSMWLMGGATVVCTLASLIQRRHARAWVCPVCGYDLRGSVHSPRCPECGGRNPLVIAQVVPAEQSTVEQKSNSPFQPERPDSTLDAA